MINARQILAKAPVVPVLSISDIGHAVPMAQALIAGGIPVLEVTLRTPVGLDAIRAIRDAVPNAIVGAGTVRNATHYAAAVDAGSQFIVTPGLTDGILAATAHAEIPLVPGVATVSEMMRALDYGIDCLKFFPAEAAGGASTLRAFSGPFPDVAFCPTGGINLHNIGEYLALPSVITVGGTWLTPREEVDRGDWEAISVIARKASHYVNELRSAT
jgi:2-dehydro-3-deoxyphosphogluconate aldolase/(4S)-4-hydroxy-2-oxoglutarate aldolase